MTAVSHGVTLAAEDRQRILQGMLSLPTSDRNRYERARARGKARQEDSSALVDARYDAGADSVELRFGGDGSMSIPRAIVPGLERASASELESVVVSPAGDALSWPSLVELDHRVPVFLDHLRNALRFGQTNQEISTSAIKHGDDLLLQDSPYRRSYTTMAMSVRPSANSPSN
jgi:hypothetical protein